MKEIKRKDIEQILRIAKECKLAGWSENDYLSELERKESFMAAAKVDKSIIGFIVARFNLSGQNDEFNSSEADLLNLGVLKNFQKKGIGRVLLESFLLEARNLDIRTIWLEVRKSNLNARQFYFRNQFIEIQERKNFYTNPSEDAVIMKLEIIDNV